MVSAAEFLLRQGNWEYALNGTLEVVPWSEKLAAHFEDNIGYGSTRATLLKLAALLHDIAKPEMKTTDAEWPYALSGAPGSGRGNRCRYHGSAALQQSRDRVRRTAR